jgi:hypothetical protein
MHRLAHFLSYEDDLRLAAEQRSTVSRSASDGHDTQYSDRALWAKWSFRGDRELGRYRHERVVIITVIMSIVTVIIAVNPVPHLMLNRMLHSFASC